MPVEEQEDNMPKVVRVSNDVESGFYLDGTLVCQCEPDELELILRSLGFDFEYREDYETDRFPDSLEGYYDTLEG